MAGTPKKRAKREAAEVKAGGKRRQAAGSIVGLAQARARGTVAPTPLPPPPPRNAEPQAVKRQRSAQALMLLAHGHKPPQIRQVLKLDTRLYNRYMARVRDYLGTGGIYDLSLDFLMERIRIADTHAVLYREVHKPGTSALEKAALLRAKIDNQKLEHVILRELGVRKPIAGGGPDPLAARREWWKSLTPAERIIELQRIEEARLEGMKSAEPKRLPEKDGEDA